MRPTALCTILSLVAPFLRVHAHTADLYFPSIPEDPYAFPKRRVSFLNGFSLPNATAQRWLAEGLKGGEAEFLGKEPIAADRASPPSPKAIEPSQQVAREPTHGDDVGLLAAVCTL